MIYMGYNTPGTVENGSIKLNIKKTTLVLDTNENETILHDDN